MTVEEISQSLKQGKCLVLYTMEDEIEKDFNAFVMSLSKQNLPNPSAISFEEFFQQFPPRILSLESNEPKDFHFSFLMTPENFFIEVNHPKALIPIINQKIVAKVTPISENYDHSVKRKDKEISKISRQKEEKPKILHPEGNEEEKKKVVVKVQSVFPPTESIEDENFEQNRGELKLGIQVNQAMKRAANTTSKAIEWSGQAYDKAKQMNMDEAKTKAFKTASKVTKKAAKWTGSLLSSIGTSFTHATQMLRGETMKIGSKELTIHRQIAQGGFSQVFLVRCNDTGKLYVIKQILCLSNEHFRDIEMECNVHRSVHHPNVLELVDVADVQHKNERQFLLLFPYYENGSVWDIIEKGLKKNQCLLSERRCLEIFNHIVLGVLALHQQGFCHQDIKPHNVLLNCTGEAVLIDLGSACFLRREVTSRKEASQIQDEAAVKSSAPYRAPELFQVEVNSVLDGQIDVWSLGCTLYAMAFGRNPFESSQAGFMKLACLNGTFTFPPGQGGFSDEFCEVIQDMLHVDPQQRPTVYDLVEISKDMLNKR